jgi:hypothetical protein
MSTSTATNDDTAPAFAGTQLEPVHVLAIKDDLP